MRKLFVIISAFYMMLILLTAFWIYWINYSKSDGMFLPNHEIVGGDFLCFYVAGEHARSIIDPLYYYEQVYCHFTQTSP